jgi:hypothetical protein
LRNPQRFDAVAPDAVAYTERQFVAVGWPAELVREPVYRLSWATVHFEWPDRIVRRCIGFFIYERFRRHLAGTGGRACTAAMAHADV